LVDTAGYLSDILGTILEPIYCVLKSLLLVGPKLRSEQLHSNS